MSTKKYRCKICGVDLSEWGPDRRGLCPPCSRGRRETMVKCAGRCGESYPLRVMEAVTLYVSPGKKGGKKYCLYYCGRCALAVRSRARRVFDVQSGEIKDMEARLAKEQRGLRKQGES